MWSHAAASIQSAIEEECNLPGALMASGVLLLRSAPSVLRSQGAQDDPCRRLCYGTRSPLQQQLDWPECARAGLRWGPAQSIFKLRNPACPCFRVG